MFYTLRTAQTQEVHYSCIIRLILLLIRRVNDNFHDISISLSGYHGSIAT